MQGFLVLLLLAWINGVALGNVSAPALVGGLILLVLSFFAWKQHSAQLVVTIICVGLLGFLYGGLTQPQSSACLLSESESGSIVAVRLEPSRVQYTVQTPQCQVLVSASRWPLYTVGDELVLRGGNQRLLSEFSEEFASYRQYLERQGIGAVWSFPNVSLSPPYEGGVPRISEAGWFSKAQQNILARINHLWPEPTASVIGAMVLAERGTIPEAILEDFRHTGTAHVLAISGLHIGIIAAALWFVVSLLPLPSWTRSVLIVTALWAYIVFIGAPVSAQRAGLFFSFLLIALRWQLLVSLPTVLLLTITALLSYQPTLVHDVGFRLSVSAVGGIFLLHFVTKPWRGVYRTMPRPGQWLIGSLLVSAGAALGTGPLIAHHFGLLSPVSVVANALIVPPLLVIVPLAVITLLTSFIFFPLALLLAWPVQLLVSWITGVAAFLARLPGAALAEVSFPATMLPLYYVSLLAIAHLFIRKQRRTWREVWE